MKKIKYEKPEMEVTLFESEDIITASSDDGLLNMGDGSGEFVDGDFGSDYEENLGE